VQRISNPEHYTVSFTWGDPSQLETVFVDGQSLVVSYNCFYTLGQLRLSNIKSPIWIDPVCTNQENNEEKGCRVRLMGSIHGRAEITMACLGPSSQVTDVARNIEHFEADEIQASDLLRSWQNLSKLANNPYFDRLWVVQELYHSK
jgi:hypothetical protein